MAAQDYAPGASSNPNVARIAMDMRKKKTDVVEPQVINNELLVKGVEEPLDPTGRDTDPIDFPKVTSLRLSFLNIIEIANLNNFNSLTTLRLDNNIIDKVANLEHLVSLTWLDLSFNNLQKIEGLTTLSKLTDLSLYHNHIEEITGLDGCMNLNILSLGHNCIKDPKQIDYLRKFHNLRCVCLDGNEVCKVDSYKQHVLAYLDNLKYLDYMLIDRKDVQQATEGYQIDELTEIREKEGQEEVKQRALREKKAIIEKLKAAFQDCTEDLFEDLFSPEIEPEAVTVLSCYPGLKEDFKDKVNEDIKGLRSFLDAKNDIRLKKVNAFEKALKNAEQESEDEAFQLIRGFKSTMKKALLRLPEAEASADGGDSAAQDIIDDLRKHLEELKSLLMANEIALQESLTEAMASFDAEIEVIIRNMTDRGSDFFAKLVEISKTFHQQLQEGAISEVEVFLQNAEGAIDIEPEKAKFLTSREEMMTATGTFNEAQTTQIQAKEDYMSNQMQGWLKKYSGDLNQRQYHRNRQRITDIMQVIKDCQEQISEAQGENEILDDNDDHA